jgi:hypothetical protein
MALASSVRGDDIEFSRMWVWVAAQMGQYFRVSGSERQTMADNICGGGPIGREMRQCDGVQKTISKYFDIE